MKAYTQGFDKGLRSAESSIGRLGGGLSSLGGVFGAVAASAAVFGGAIALGKVVMAGAELNATLSKTRIIFGEAAGEIFTHADQMASAYGIVKTDYIDAAASF